MHAKVKEHWFAVCRSSKLKRSPLPVVLFGQPIVIFRTSDGVHALLDRCPHRHAPLSGGRLIENQLQCRYHGWRFSGAGKCVLVPGSTSDPPRCSVPAFACQEQDGIVWVSPEGDGTVPPPSMESDGLRCEFKLSAKRTKSARLILAREVRRGLFSDFLQWISCEVWADFACHRLLKWNTGTIGSCVVELFCCSRRPPKEKSK